MSEPKAARHVDVRIATYNIHRCRGMDRRVVPSRIAEVIRELDADVIALQEVIGAGPRGPGQAAEIGAALGMGWVMHSVRQLRNHQFGNVVLSRFPIVHHGTYDLSWRTCEQRACQRADLDMGEGVPPAHLQRPPRHRGARASLPGRPARGLRPRSPRQGPEGHPGRLQRVDEGARDQDAVSTVQQHRHRQHLKRRRTYPGIFPVLHLDHIYYEGDVTVTSMELVRTRKSLMASDHLPLVANFRIGF